MQMSRNFLFFMRNIYKCLFENKITTNAIPAPAFAGVNLSPQKRGTGIHCYDTVNGYPPSRV